jgi:streptogramin lyase
MFRLGVLVAAAVAVLTSAVPAHGAVVTRYGGFAIGSLGGIAAGADGNLWVAEESADKITKMSQTGHFQPGGSGGDRPTGLVQGPSTAGPRGSGSVWVALTNSKAIARIDTLSGAQETISTAGVSDCGPRGITVGPGAGYMYFSLPNPGDGSCTSPSMIGWFPILTFSPVSAAAGFGTAYALSATADRLFVADYDGNAIRRAVVAQADGTPTVEATHPIPGGGSPRGITATRAGQVWSTLFTAGTLARVDATAGDGVAAQVVDPGQPFGEPTGIVTGGDGYVYAASHTSDRIARIAPDGRPTVFPLAGAYSPWELATSPDPLSAEIWMTNRDDRTIARFVHGAPRPLTGGYSEGPNDAFVSGTVDPQGIESQAYYEYGTTTAYGKVSATSTLEASTDFRPPLQLPPPAPINPTVLDKIPVGPVSVSGELTGLTPRTTYHYRLVATNSEGTRVGADRTFTTPAPVDRDGDGHSPPQDCDDNDKTIHPGARDTFGDDVDQNCDGVDGSKLQRLRALVTVSARKSGSLTRVRTLRVTRLAGGETVKVTCKGRGCKFKSRTRKAKRGAMKLESLFKGRALRPGARVVVRVTKAATIGSSVSITARRSGKPSVVRRCVRPGAKPSIC